MEPGKTQEIPYTVFNRTDKSVTVETLIHSATTNSNGVIEYGESKSKFDETLSYDMKNLAKTVGEITVPPQSAVTETLSLKAPEKELAGVVAGGITFQEKKENVSNKSTVGVVNQFSQVKAILIRNSATNSSGTPSTISGTGAEGIEIPADQAVDLVTAGANEGIGTWIYSLGENVEQGRQSVELFVPVSNYAVDNYVSTFTWSLTDAPTEGKA